MAEIKWIKITTSIFDDEAIKIIEQMPEGDAILIIWFKLLIQAGIINDSGLVYFKKDIPYTEDMLAIVFHKPITLIRLALTTFEKFGMIEIADNQSILIRNWEKHQNVSGMEQVREYNRLAKRKQRQKAKELKLLSDSQGQCQGHVQESHETDIDIDIDIDKEYIYLSSSIEENSKNKISDDEREILKKYLKKNNPNIKNIRAYLKKVIENGDYIDILNEEKAKLKKEDKSNIDEDIKQVKDKLSAIRFIAKYGDQLSDVQLPQVEKIMKEYSFNNFDEVVKASFNYKK